MQVCADTVASSFCCTQGVTVSKCVAGNRNQSWEFFYSNKLRSAGVNMCLGLPGPLGEGELYPPARRCHTVRSAAACQLACGADASSAYTWGSCCLLHSAVSLL
jgi:hypothetical protein